MAGVRSDVLRVSAVRKKGAFLPPGELRACLERGRRYNGTAHVLLNVAFLPLLGKIRWIGNSVPMTWNVRGGTIYHPSPCRR